MEQPASLHSDHALLGAAKDGAKEGLLSGENALLLEEKDLPTEVNARLLVESGVLTAANALPSAESEAPIRASVVRSAVTVPRAVSEAPLHGPVTAALHVATDRLGARELHAARRNSSAPNSVQVPKDAGKTVEDARLAHAQEADALLQTAEAHALRERPDLVLLALHALAPAGTIKTRFDQLKRERASDLNLQTVETGCKLTTPMLFLF